eukprot:gene37197-42130_t
MITPRGPVTFTDADKLSKRTCIVASGWNGTIKSFGSHNPLFTSSKTRGSLRSQTAVLLLVSCIGSTKDPDGSKSKIIGLEAAIQNLRSSIQSYRPSKRNLVIYHVEDIGLGDTALDVTMNNVKLFVASILHHDPNSAQSAFYLINV